MVLHTNGSQVKSVPSTVQTTPESSLGPLPLDPGEQNGIHIYRSDMSWEKTRAPGDEEHITGENIAVMRSTCVKGGDGV